jgi:putative chitinase
MLKLHRQTFFKAVRNAPFPGRLSQAQVEGMNDLLDVWIERGTADPRHLAYAFATDYHETGAKMQPVREGFKATDKLSRAWVLRHYGHKGPKWYCFPAGQWGHVYYGRGDVQLTWYENYVLMGKILRIPLAENPDLALQSKVSKAILVEGMLRGKSSRGDFTGKALEDYFNDRDDDPRGARRIVNGTDRAGLIAGYYEEFYVAIMAAVRARENGDVDLDSDPLAPALPVGNDQASWGGAISAVGGVAAAFGGAIDKLGTPTLLLLGGLVLVGAVLFVRGRRNILNETGR